MKGVCREEQAGFAVRAVHQPGLFPAAIEVKIWRQPVTVRFSVILAPADYTAWLSADTAPDQAQALIQPCPEAMLAAYPVSTTVGNVRNDCPVLIQPV